MRTKKPEAGEVAIISQPVPAPPIKDTNDEGEMAQAAKPTLNEKELKEGNKRYADKVNEFLNKDKATLESVLKLQWNKGSFVDELFRNPGHWGNNTADRFAEDVNISVETLYRCRKFFLTYTAEEVKQAADQRISWHNIYYLVGVEDKTKRLELQSKVAENELSSADLQQKVKNFNKSEKTAGTKKEKRGGASSKVVFRVICSLCQELTHRIDEYHDATDALNDMEDGKTKVELSIQHDNALKAMHQLELKVAKLHDEGAKD